MKSSLIAGMAALLIVGLAGAAEAPGGFQPGKSYTVSCGPADAQGNFTCQHKLVAEAPVAAAGTAPGAKVAAVSPAAAAASAATASTPPKLVSPADAVGKAVVAKTADEAIGNLLQADLSIPASPAAALLGISADKVQRPGSVRELTASLVRGIGPDGKIQSAVALDLAPAFVFFPKFIGAGDVYAPANATSDSDGGWQQRVRRMLARTTLSFGTTNPDATGAARSALGLRVGLYDSGDPGLYWSKVVNCVSQIEGVIPPGPTKPGKPAEPIEVDYSKCDPTKDAADNLWAKPSLYAGYGQSWYSKTGALTDRAPDVRQLWLSGSLGWAPAEDKQGEASDLRVLGQLYIGRRLNDRTPDPKDASQLLRQDSTDTVLRVRVGRTSWHGFLEYGRNRVRLGDIRTRNLRHTAYGAEFQLGAFGGTDNWLEIASVRSEGVMDGKTYSGVLLNYRIGTPSLGLPESGAVAARK